MYLLLLDVRYIFNNENTLHCKTTLDIEGLDVDKMDYLLRDAAALRINLKWEVGPDLRLKFLLFVPFCCFFYKGKVQANNILFQLERFLEAGEPKLMDHHDWGQEESEETQKDKENNIEVKFFICFG